MSSNKAECEYLSRDKDHPSLMLSIAQNEKPYEKYVGVCTASGDFPQSVQCFKLTKTDISKCCETIPKFNQCIRYKLKIYGNI
jgi:hypothetical protein